jgi:hypothetical protein
MHLPRWVGVPSQLFFFSLVVGLFTLAEDEQGLAAVLAHGKLLVKFYAQYANPFAHASHY